MLFSDLDWFLIQVSLHSVGLAGHAHLCENKIAGN